CHVSCIYEAIFARASETELRAALATVAPHDSAFAFVSVGSFSAACRQSGRTDGFSPAKMNGLAARVSAIVRTSIVAYYDDRVGLREAIAFAEGKPTKEFGPPDELWSPLDEDGCADSTIARHRRDFGDEEIECVVSAISLALQTLGAEHLEARALHHAVVAVA
ncbi:MAG: hypothetical protein ACXWN1_10400, partial [Thermoanaerobaculia bacterium]